MRIAVLAACALAVSGCVSAQSSLVYGTFSGSTDRPVTFCDNYAQQTYFNSFEDQYEPGEGFGSREFARANARRAADRAYERCLAGRTN